MVCLAPPLFLLVYLHANVGLQGLPATILWGPQAAPCWSAAAWTNPLHNKPPSWVHQPPFCHHSSLPSCVSLPLLPVWMNVSSLTPWLLDFHTLRFSVSSGCFLFLNCCCPCFGCERRHSVSTYASILARSWQNRDIYWRRYKMQETVYVGQCASVPFKVGSLGPHTVLPTAARYSFCSGSRSCRMNFATT